MADETHKKPAPALLDVVLLTPLNTTAVALLLSAIVVVTTLGAFGLAQLQGHYGAQLQQGTQLSGIAGVIGHGSSLATVWPGWLAGLFFAVALARLHRGSPEPPAGRKSVDDLSISEMRAGLRAEYTGVRIALVIVVVLALIDTERMVAIAVEAIRGLNWARASLALTSVEAAGWIVASVLLCLWAIVFRGQIQRWGAV